MIPRSQLVEQLQRFDSEGPVTLEQALERKICPVCLKPVKGESIYCRKHLDPTERRFKKMAYNLSGELKKFVEEQVSTNPDDQVKIFEELALFRHAAGQVVKLYNEAVTRECAEREDKAKQAQDILVRGNMMQKTLEQVSILCQRAAAIDSTISARLTVSSIGYVIETILQLTATILHESMSAMEAERIIAVLEDQIAKRVNFTDTRGTNITPDMDAVDMDKSLGIEGPKQEF